MKRSEAKSIILATAPKWLIVEMDDACGERRDLNYWGEPEGWEVDYDVVDWLEDTHLIWNSDRMQRAIKKIDKALGVYVQVQEGDEVQTLSSSGCRRLRVGEWYHNKRYDELIERR